MPSEGLKQLGKFWQDIRANLAKSGLKMGRDMFGCSVFEAHESSVLHKHILLYHSKNDKSVIDQVVQGVESRGRQQYNSKLRFDISNYDEKKGAAGASYIFKYITKTCGSNENIDKNTLKNMAVRWYYSARAFNFFGIKQSTTKFNFLCDNYKRYKDALSNDIIKMFECFDYYTFITTYEKYFKIVRDQDKKINFVLFDFAGNNLLPSKLGVKDQLIIEKKNYSLFEVNAKTEALTDINKLFELNTNLITKEVLTLDSDELSNVKTAFEYVVKLEKEYKENIVNFISQSNDNNYTIDTLNNIPLCFLSNRVTVNQSLSKSFKR